MSLPERVQVHGEGVAHLPRRRDGGDALQAWCLWGLLVARCDEEPDDGTPTCPDCLRERARHEEG